MSSDFNKYQIKAFTYCKPELYGNLSYYGLGLTGEAGEVAGKLAKSIRDGDLSHTEVAKELGDVLWFVAGLAGELGYSLEQIAALNLAKLKDRAERGVLSGSGDNR